MIIDRLQLKRRAYFSRFAGFAVVKTTMFVTYVANNEIVYFSIVGLWNFCFRMIGTYIPQMLNTLFIHCEEELVVGTCIGHVFLQVLHCLDGVEVGQLVAEHQYSAQNGLWQ